MRRPGLAAPVLLALASAAGCGSKSNDGPAPRSGKGAGEACASEGECQAGLFCFASQCASSYLAAATCGPPGAAPPPQAGAAIDVGLRACVTAPATPVFPNVQGGGIFTVGQKFDFTVLAGTTGFSIVSQLVDGPDFILYRGAALPNAPVPTDVRAPDGSLFYSDTASPPMVHGYFDPTGMLAYYLGYGPVTGVFTVPNTSGSLDLVRSAGEVPPGLWSFTVNDWANECLDIRGCSGGTSTSKYRVDVLTHSGAATAPFLRTTGTLDLELYLATSSATFPNGAADAASNAHVARLVQTMRTYYAGAGICIGNVTFHDLPQWAKDLYAPGGVVDIGGGPPCDSLSQLFTLAVEGSGPAVHLFLADELLDKTGGTPGFTTLGVDGAIPGPSGVPGTVVGGAIVGLFDQLGLELASGACSGPPDPGRCGADLVAYVAAHEAGHWLGLYHTTESRGDLFDPLADTATCPCLSCAPVYQRGACSEVASASSPTLMENSFCASTGPKCGGGRNLMFWLVDEKLSTGELTFEQGEVMRQNPAVQ